MTNWAVDSVEESLKCDYWSEIDWAVLSAIHYTPDSIILFADPLVKVFCRKTLSLQEYFLMILYITLYNMDMMAISCNVLDTIIKAPNRLIIKKM